ncbi:class I SAM-dependent methyltransferase [Nocardioides sp.]|uniref:class I SAM-dependent methyltransferase n=1 Tax=Nocardioides sp. TaxID=35761 RepID=UPI0035613BC5
MHWWEAHVLPRLVDVVCSQGPIMKLRGQVCEGLTGRVIEIGFGSGLNLAVLPDEVTSVDAVEPNDLGWERSAARRDQSRRPVNRIGLDGQSLVADDATYDTALITFALCTIPDPHRALEEVHRVLKSGGQLHFVEHGLAPDESVRRWQRRLEPIQRRVAGGCHLTRVPEDMVRSAGLVPHDVAHRYLGGGPGKPLGYLTWGRATKA